MLFYYDNFAGRLLDPIKAEVFKNAVITLQTINEFIFIFG